MATHDQQLFHKPLADRSKTTPASKKHWLASVQLAVHDFTEVHGRIPTQLTITLYFSKTTPTNSNTTTAPISMFQNSMSQLPNPEL
eukprot:3685314-Ditylum_brightwellii.AAC.1